MDEKQNGRRNGRPKKQNDQQSTGSGRTVQGERLPRPDAIKRAIDPAEFYRAI